VNIAKQTKGVSDRDRNWATEAIMSRASAIVSTTIGAVLGANIFTMSLVIFFEVETKRVSLIYLAALVMFAAHTSWSVTQGDFQYLCQFQCPRRRAIWCYAESETAAATIGGRQRPDGSMGMRD
jgi:hypothetical protein